MNSWRGPIKGQAYGDPEADEEERLVDDRTVRLRNLDGDW